MNNHLCKTGYHVYLPVDGEYRALFIVENPRLTRTIALQVSTHRSALTLAEILYREFQLRRLINRQIPLAIRRLTLSELLYKYIGWVYRIQCRQWATANGYRRNLKDLFIRCRWARLDDVTAESFLKWRHAQRRSQSQLNRILRDANAFFDSLVVQGAAAANPLRSVRSLSDAGATSRDETRHENLANHENPSEIISGNSLKTIVGGSTEKAADPSQGSGIQNITRALPLQQTDPACSEHSLERA